MGSGFGLKTVFGSIYVVKQLSFSMFPLILTFVFDLILGSFLSFWGPNELFLGRGLVQKLFWGLIMYLNNFHFYVFFNSNIRI